MPAVLVLVRWTARLSGVVVAGFCWLLVVAEYLLPAPSGLLEWLSIVFTLITGVALIIAWHWERLGAVLSLTALGALALLTPWHYLLHFTLLMMAVPGILHLANWLARHALAQHALTHHP